MTEQEIRDAAELVGLAVAIEDGGVFLARTDGGRTRMIRVATDVDPVGVSFDEAVTFLKG